MIRRISERIPLADSAPLRASTQQVHNAPLEAHV